MFLSMFLLLILKLEKNVYPITHYRGAQYLNIVDCGPSRFAIWKEIRMGTAYEIAKIVNGFFWSGSGW